MEHSRLRPPFALQTRVLLACISSQLILRTLLTTTSPPCGRKLGLGSHVLLLLLPQVRASCPCVALSMSQHPAIRWCMLTHVCLAVDVICLLSLLRSSSFAFASSCLASLPCAKNAPLKLGFTRYARTRLLSAARPCMLLWRSVHRCLTRSVRRLSCHDRHRYYSPRMCSPRRCCHSRLPRHPCSVIEWLRGLS